MFAQLISALLFVLFVQGSPLSLRDVIAPKITSPTAGTVWPIGTTQTVTWDTSNFPPVSQITNILGKVILGRDANDSLNLDFDHPLAQNFNLTDGSVKITVPAVSPGDDYLIVLFGDSGNTSPDFSIANVTVPISSPSTTDTLITTPIPITGSTITGGEATSTTSTDGTIATDSPTSSSTDTATLPVTTATTPASTTTGTSNSTSTTASPTQTTSAAWPIHHTNGMLFRTFSFLVCTAAALVLV